MSIVGVVVLVGIVWLFINYRAERAEEASLAMFKAENLYINGQYALAASEFENVIEQYSGSVPAKKAVFFAGDAHFKAGEYEQALSRFEEGREKYSAEDPLRLNCLVGLAAVYEQFEEYDKAIETYREALALARYDFQRFEIMSSLSRVLAMAGRNTEAVETMDRIIETYPDYPLTGEIIELRAELIAKMRASS